MLQKQTILEKVRAGCLILTQPLNGPFEQMCTNFDAVPGALAKQVGDASRTEIALIVGVMRQLARFEGGDDESPGLLLPARAV